ncbi:MAG: hypothetical protein ACI8VW_003950, partial [bacterium]
QSSEFFARTASDRVTENTPALSFTKPELSSDDPPLHPVSVNKNGNKSTRKFFKTILHPK